MLSHSTSAPVLPPASTLVSYCIFSLASQEKAGETQVQWSHHGPGSSYETNYTTSAVWGEGNRTVNTSITVVQLSDRDGGVFTAQVSNRCGRASCQITLYVTGACEYKKPSPVDGNHSQVIVPESKQVQLHSVYRGDPDPSHFGIVWEHKGTPLLGGNTSSKYQSKHKEQGNCSFSSTLTVRHTTYLDSGNYTAMVTGGKEGRSNVTVNLQVVPWPVVGNQPGRKVELGRGSRTAKLTYEVLNYTQYVALMFKCDGHTLNNPDYSILSSPEEKTATVTLVATQGDFQMCIGYKPAVTAVQHRICSQSTAVSEHGGGGVASLAGGVSAATLLAGILITLVTLICIKKKRHTCGRSEPTTSSIRGGPVETDYGSTSTTTGNCLLIIYNLPVST